MTSKCVRWRLKSPESRLFTQPFVQAQITENIKAPRHWPLWGGFTGDRCSNLYALWDVITDASFHFIGDLCARPVKLEQGRI